jgi:hypothetical protein
MSNIRRIIANIVPHGIVRMREKHKEAINRAIITDRLQKIREQTQLNGKEPYSYPGAVEYLRQLGLPESHIRDGSMPESSLKFCINRLRERFGVLKHPPIGLHVGNFVGVSLSYLAHAAQQYDRDSLIVAVDPNIQHRTIRNPASHVLSLLKRFDLQGNVILCTGFSLEKNVGDDGTQFSSSDDPFERFTTEYACENILINFGKLGRERFDFCAIDGNHDATYLRRELDAVYELINEDGLLLIDDVSPAWREIIEVTKALPQSRWLPEDADGRVAIFKKISSADHAMESRPR